MARTDVHQHLWLEPLLAALAARSAPPRVRRERPGVWRLELAGEPPSWVEADDVGARAALVHLDGLDRALVALSTALGVETLPPAEAAPLLAAHAEATAALPPELAPWAAVALADPDEAAAELAIRLRTAVGLCLPAAALASTRAIERLGPVLAALERTGAPLLVHPGPAATPDDAPAWWPALTDYVAQLQAAWLAFAAAGRDAHPELRVVFAALGGLAPLHAERLAVRGGPAEAIADERLFYDTSSYGPAALTAMSLAVGQAQLVHGSDRPVVVPPAPPGVLGPQAWQALTQSNPARLLAPIGAPA
jgi:predicted TIM-barrel fold metal-dependent hydrolase